MSRVVCLVPAHNEEDCLPKVLYSLVRQTRRPDKVIVIADNCDDRTVEVAEPYRVGFCVEVFETVGNRHKKAGALNQVLGAVLPRLGDEDMVLVMDADSYLDEGFIESAEERLAASWSSTSRYGGVGGTFRGRSGGGFVGMLQRNEYARYARDIRRLKGKVLCLTGTAALFSVKALKEVAKGRPSGDVYDVEVLTEDFELTLALKHLGYEVVSPKECTLTTEVMESWGDLARQRLRWKRGAVENLIQYGLTQVTLEHWARQLMTLTGIFVMALFLGTVAYSLIVAQEVHFYPLWISVTGIFVVERAITVHKRGWKMSFLASVLFVEMLFDLFLQAVHLKAYWQVLARSERSW